MPSFSVFLLTPAYLGKYFDEAGRLNLWGEVSHVHWRSRHLLSDVAGSHDAADDTESHWRLALETQPTLRAIWL